MKNVIRLSPLVALCAIAAALSVSTLPVHAQTPAKAPAAKKADAKKSTGTKKASTHKTGGAKHAAHHAASPAKKTPSAAPAAPKKAATK